MIPRIGWLRPPTGRSNGARFRNPLSAIICNPAGSGGICKCLKQVESLRCPTNPGPENTMKPCTSAITIQFKK